MTSLQNPVFLVCPPRSGSTLLFRTLAMSADVWTVWVGNHQVIEGINGLHPADRDWESNRLTWDDATPGVGALLRDRYLDAARNRRGQRPSGHRSIHLLDKNPKNSLRIGFLARVFPDARFVYLYREPIEVVSSMLEAWQSDRFVTYPELPEWVGAPWSFLLVPGWRRLDGLDLPHVVAQQWVTATDILLDDIHALPADQWLTTRFDSFLDDPTSEVDRICAHLGMNRDRAIERQLPLSTSTLSPPTPGKWRRHAAVLARVWPVLACTADRAARATGLPATQIRPDQDPPITA